MLNGVLFVLVWVACLLGRRASVGTWEEGLGGWHASVGEMGALLAWVT